MICKNHEILEPVWLHFFHHSISITHHSIFHTRLASSPNFYHSIFFTLFVGSYLSVGTVIFYFFFSTQLTETNNKKIKNKIKKPNSQPRKRKKKKKRKKESNSQPRKKKKVKMVKSCG